ncbi:MAG: hypothetical protein ACT4PT_05195, partial [Methanobacteriota archaeon]
EFAAVSGAFLILFAWTGLLVEGKAPGARTAGLLLLAASTTIWALVRGVLDPPPGPVAPEVVAAEPESPFDLAGSKELVFRTGRVDPPVLADAPAPRAKPAPWPWPRNQPVDLSPVRDDEFDFGRLPITGPIVAPKARADGKLRGKCSRCGSRLLLSPVAGPVKVRCPVCAHAKVLA